MKKHSTNMDMMMNGTESARKPGDDTMATASGSRVGRRSASTAERIWLKRPAARLGGVPSTTGRRARQKIRQSRATPGGARGWVMSRRA